MFGWFNSKKPAVQPQPDSLVQRYEALKADHRRLSTAVYFMGLDPAAVVDRLKPSSTQDPHLQMLPFRLASVVVDPMKDGNSDISAQRLAYGQAALDSLRHGNAARVADPAE